jgi:hypothetical protein
MPRSTADARSAKKSKLGNSDCSFLCSSFVASSSHSTVPPVTHYCTLTDIRSSPVRLFDHSRRGTPHMPSRSLAATPATQTTPPRPLLPSTPWTADVTHATSTVVLTPVTATPPTAAPMRRQLRPSIRSSKFARPPDKARSPFAATLPGLRARWAEPAIARRSACSTTLAEGRLTLHHALSPPLPPIGRPRLNRSCHRHLGPLT